MVQVVVWGCIGRTASQAWARRWRCVACVTAVHSDDAVSLYGKNAHRACPREGNHVVRTAAVLRVFRTAAQVVAAAVVVQPAASLPSRIGFRTAAVARGGVGGRPGPSAAAPHRLHLRPRPRWWRRLRGGDNGGVRAREVSPSRPGRVAAPRRLHRPAARRQRRRRGSGLWCVAGPRRSS